MGSQSGMLTEVGQGTFRCRRCREQLRGALKSQRGGAVRILARHHEYIGMQKVQKSREFERIDCFDSTAGQDSADVGIGDLDLLGVIESIEPGDKGLDSFDFGLEHERILPPGHFMAQLDLGKGVESDGRLDRYLLTLVDPSLVFVRNRELYGALFHSDLDFAIVIINAHGKDRPGIRDRNIAHQNLEESGADRVQNEGGSPSNELGEMACPDAPHSQRRVTIHHNEGAGTVLDSDLVLFAQMGCDYLRRGHVSSRLE